MSHWYQVNNINTVDSPALLVYPRRVKANIAQLVAMAGDVRWLRPHVKTNKMAAVCSLMLEAGISRFKCATIAEAEMLGMIQAPDVLLAYQPVGPKMERFLRLIKQYPQTQFSCLIDNPAIAAALSDASAAQQLQVNAFIDLNTGMNRSGIEPEKALDLFNACQTGQGVQIIGLHAYDGHIRDTDLRTRNQRSDEAFRRVEQLAAAIASVSMQPLQIVVGGSPTFPTHTKRKGVEYSPGTFVFWDWGYKHQLPDEPFDYAALVITRIISVIDEHRICTDLGHKSVAAENPLRDRVHFLNAPDAVITGQSEEHLVLQVPDSSQWKAGDVLYGVPVHICPTVALYDTAVVVEDQEAITQWPVIARQRKITV